jgi:hypothetical protein
VDVMTRPALPVICCIGDPAQLPNEEYGQWVALRALAALPLNPPVFLTGALLPLVATP